MSTLRERTIGFSTAAFVLAALFVLTSINAAEEPAELTVTEDFAAVDGSVLRSWTAKWDEPAQAVTLKTGTTTGSWFTIGDLSGVRTNDAAFSSTYDSDRTAFIAASDGIYRTVNAGATWTKSLALPNEAMGVVLSPAFGADGTAFAITNGSGFWKTTDRGERWTQVDATLNGFGLALSPAFVSDRTVFVAAFNRVLRSSDAGTTWTEITAGFSDTVRVNGDIRAIAPDPQYTTNRTIYVTTVGDGLYRSRDDGGSWTVANPPQVSVPYASAIATHGATNRVAVVFLSGIFTTNDAGVTWTAAYTGDDAEDVAYGSDGTLFFGRSTGVARASRGLAVAVATGWSAGAATSVAIAPTYPQHGSAIAGSSAGPQILLSGYASSGVAESVAGIDATSHRIATAIVTPNAAIPQGTSIAYELSTDDAKATWEGPVEPGKPWVFTANGSTLRWRVTLRTARQDAAPILHGFTIAYTTDATLTAPKLNGATPTATSIRWNFTSTATDVTGYEVVNTTTGKVVATTEDPKATFVEEITLTPDTNYCSRRVFAVRDAARSPASEPYACATTLAARPPAATVSEVTSSSALVTIAPGKGNGDATLYALRERTSGLYVGVDGAYGAKEAVWKRLDVWGADGAVLVIGLTPDTSYAFCAQAQNRVGAVSDCAADAHLRTTGDAPRGDVTMTITARDERVLLADDAISVTMALTQVGAGTASDVRVRIPKPTGAVYVSGSLRLNGAPITDVADDDAGDVGASVADGATIGPLTLGAGATITVGAAFRVTGQPGHFVSIVPSLEYRPFPNAVVRTVVADPLNYDIGGRAIVEPEPLPEQEQGQGREQEQPTQPQPEQPAEGTPPTAEAPRTAPEYVPPTAPKPEIVATTDVLPSLPVITLDLEVPRDGAVLAVGDVTVRGIATLGQTVTIGLDGRAFWKVEAGTDGVFSLVLRDVAPGRHRIGATLPPASDGAQFDIVPPPTESLVLTAPADGSATNALTLVVAGRGPAGLPVVIGVDGADVATATIGANGGFIALLPTGAVEGAHRVTARATTEFGLVLEAATTVTVDRTAPDAPAVRELQIVRQVPAPSGDGFQATIALRGDLTTAEFAALDALLVTVASEPVTFTVRPDAPAWRHEVTVALTPGAHTVRVAARDRAGNVSPLPQLLQFDIRHAACGDGVDNDNDGATDYPADAGCANAFDDNEATEGVVERTVNIVTETTTATAKAVVGVTEQTAKATATVAEQAAAVVEKQVLDNPAVEVATERVVAPTVVVAVAANTATTVQGFQFLAYAQYLIGFLLTPSRLFARRKRAGWGTVYHALTKRPVDLATVRLVDAASGRVMQTEVTDHLGRYHFPVKHAGEYRIEVRHGQQTFPSTLLAGKAEDSTFTDLYFGESFTADEGTFIMKNIPLDPKEVKEQSDAQVVRQHYGRIVSGAVSDTGLVLSFVSFAVSPRPYVGVILGVNVIFYILFRRLASHIKVPRSWGAVREALKRKPVHLAIVRLFDEEFNKLLATAATDRYGRYRFLVGKSMYYVTAEKRGYDRVRSKSLDLTKEEGVVGVDLRLKPSGAADVGQES